MSLLIVGLSREVTSHLIPLLTGQGDEVRIVERDGSHAESWRALGAHVARGSVDDDDLIERAAQNVRTLVVGDGATPETLEGAHRAGVGRIVHLGNAFTVDEIASAGGEFVILRPGVRRRVMRRGRLDPVDAARLIDAADDVAGEVRLDLDALDPAAWKLLGLDVPVEG